MATADGGQQQAGGSHQAVPYDPQIGSGAQQVPQGALVPFPHDGGQQAPAGSQLALPIGPQMPERLTIGTAKAFKNNYAFPYKKIQVEAEIIYVCNKGSEWARANEMLVLRCVDDIWTASDSALTADRSALHCRQPVFRCLATDITQPGWHSWQTNHAAGPDEDGLAVDWRGALWAETRLQ